MRDNSSRRAYLRVVGAGAAISLAGCGGNQPDDTPAATDEPEDTEDDTATPTPEQTKTYTGGSLSLASPGPVQTLDPVNAKGSGAGYNQYQESLLNFPNGDLPAQPDLAETVDISNDGLVYTIKLKEGVLFHDGQELTADDVVYSWERLAQSDNSRNKDDIIGSTFTIAHEGNTDESLENYEPGSLAVEAKSDYVFEFEMETAFHAVEDNIAGGAFGIIPENSVGDIEGYDGEYDYQEFFSTAGDGPFFVGTGPFKVDTWSKGDAITLTRFEDYHGEGPYIDEITYTNIPNANTRWERFKNGNLDMVGGVPLSKFDPDARTIERDVGTYETGTYDLPSGDTVEYGQSTPLDTDYLVFNAQRTPVEVRRAIGYLVNPQQISETIYKGLNPPAYHLSPPAVFPAASDEEPVDVYQRHAEEGYRSQTEFAADGYPFGMTESRIDQARTVMEDAGYGPDSPYEVEFTVFSGDPEWDAIAKRIRDKATNAHINISIVKADFGTIIGKALGGEMDMFSLGDGMEWPESDNFLRFLRPYDDPSGMFTRWTFEDQSKYTDLMEFAKETWSRYQENKGPSEEEQQIRDEVYLTMEEINWESVQEFPLVHGSTQRFQQPRVNVRMAGTMENQKLNRLTLED